MQDGIDELIEVSRWQREAAKIKIQSIYDGPAWGRFAIEEIGRLVVIGLFVAVVATWAVIAAS